MSFIPPGYSYYFTAFFSEHGYSWLDPQLVALIRKQVGTLADLKSTVIVKQLPKTLSGALLRKVKRPIAGRRAYSIPSTIDAPDFNRIGRKSKKSKNRKRNQ